MCTQSWTFNLNTLILRTAHGAGHAHLETLLILDVHRFLAFCVTNIASDVLDYLVADRYV
jgi:hypothetical protein